MDLLQLPPLRRDQVQSFGADGFLVLRGFFSATEVAAWRQRLLVECAVPPSNWAAVDDGAARGASTPSWLSAPEGSRGRLQAGTRYEPTGAGIDPDNPHGLLFVQGTNLLGNGTWLSLIMERRVVGAMTSLLGPDVNFHSMKATCKPPRHRSRQGFHQDSFYIEEAPPQKPVAAAAAGPEPPADAPPPFATILIYLDATAKGAGATKIARGSHRGQTGLHGGLYSEEAAHGQYRGGLTMEAVTKSGCEILTPAMAAGDAMIIHSHVAHSVGDNSTDHTRIALAHVYKNAHWVDDTPGQGNTRSWAELPVARGGELAFQLAPALLPPPLEVEVEVEGERRQAARL